MRHAIKRHYEWSTTIAYSVGLMASDGCLQSDGRHLDLTSVDMEQLENFSTAIGRPLTISPKHNKAGSRAYRIQFSDVAYYDFLVGAGLTPRKSKTMPNLIIPDEYYSHFLRGLFDGDGTTYAYHDPRWKSSYLYYIGFTSASILFLDYLLLANMRLIGTEGRSVRKSARAYILGYGKKDSYKIYLAMYRNANGLFLTRKKVKLEGFVKENNDAIII
jgi:hypothetical protein